MVRFDWKYTDKDQWPPEPGVTKNYWKYENPGLTVQEVMEWYEEHFEVYACRLRGIPGPVPSQLYYIGDNEFMGETGHVFREGSVVAWDSYTEDTE